MLVAAALGGTATPASGQVHPSLDLGTGSGLSGDLAAANSLILRPRLHSRLAAVALDGSVGVARHDAGEWSWELAGTGRWMAPELFGVVRLGAELQGRRGRYADGVAPGRWLGLARVELRGRRLGLELSAGGGQASDGSAWGGMRRAAAGLSATVGDLSILLSARTTSFRRAIVRFVELPGTPVDSVGDAPPSFERRESLETRSYSEAELTVGWAAGRLALELAAGARLGDGELGDDSWARVGGSLRVTSMLSAIASAGRWPGAPEQGLEPRAFYLVGVRLTLPPRSAPEAATPAATPRPGLTVHAGADQATRLLRLWMHGAERVELAGDFTDWRPAAMRRAGRGLWELALPIDPGVYRVNLRVDAGPWIVPPGLTRVRDEFNGEVGLLVVR